MSKITFPYVGTTYTLEFDRDSAAKTEQLFGVSLNTLDEFQLSRFEALFHGALLKHHPRIKTSTVQAMFRALDNKVELYTELSKMFAETLETALEDGDPAGEVVSWERG